MATFGVPLKPSCGACPAGGVMIVNPVRSVTFIIAALLISVVIRPVMLTWYGDSLLSNFATGATIVALALIAVVIVNKMRRQP